MTIPCSWCGSQSVVFGTTCPKSIVCPQCGSGPGTRCKRPSGHDAAELHHDRIAEAERLDRKSHVPSLDEPQ